MAKKVFSAFFARAPTFLWEMAHDRGFLKKFSQHGSTSPTINEMSGQALSPKYSSLPEVYMCQTSPLIRQIYALTKYNVAGRGA